MSNTYCSILRCFSPRMYFNIGWNRGTLTFKIAYGPSWSLMWGHGKTSVYLQMVGLLNMMWSITGALFRVVLVGSFTISVKLNCYKISQYQITSGLEVHNKSRLKLPVIIDSPSQLDFTQDKSSSNFGSQLDGLVKVGER